MSQTVITAEFVNELAQSTWDKLRNFGAAPKVCDMAAGAVIKRFPGIAGVRVPPSITNKEAIQQDGEREGWLKPVSTIHIGRKGAPSDVNDSSVNLSGKAAEDLRREVAAFFNRGAAPAPINDDDE